MTEALLDCHDALLLDLDGTVYRGAQAVSGARDVVCAARERAVPVRFVTNNASRATAAVAGRLRAMGVPAEASEIATSAQAGARLLAEGLASGSRVLVVGAEALADEIRAAGLVPVRSADEPVAAVVQGFADDVGWRQLSEAMIAIKAGARWVACNLDATLPTERGELPGNGSLVAALRTATGAEPEVAGKPARPLLDAAVDAVGASRALMVGDRLETDIAGAHAAGLDAMLVLSGVSRAAELLVAPPEHRPRYLAADVRAVLAPYRETVITAQQRGWRVEATGAAELHATGQGDDLALLRALCAVWWQRGAGSAVTVRAGTAAARAALTRLGLH